MRDALRGLAALANLHELGLAHDLHREPHHIVGHGGGEEQRLPRRRRRHRRDDAPDVGPEPHVHHAVRLVEHEQLDAAQIGILLSHVIDQAARRRDDDVDARFERALLRAHLDAAVDGGARDGRVIRQPVDFVLDLHGQLARRREHQHAAARLVRRGLGSFAHARQQRSWSAVSSRCRIGTTNAHVLPVPVSAQAMESPPASASGMTAVWMGRVSAKPESRTPSRSRSIEPERCERDRRDVAGRRLERGRVRRGGTRLRRGRPTARPPLRRPLWVPAWMMCFCCIGTQTYFWLAGAEGDDASDRIVRRHADGHPVPGNNLDAESTHATAELGEHFVSGVALHTV